MNTYITIVRVRMFVYAVAFFHEIFPFASLHPYHYDNYTENNIRFIYSVIIRTRNKPLKPTSKLRCSTSEWVSAVTVNHNRY